jgi:hypothetical protein
MSKHAVYALALRGKEMQEGLRASGRLESNAKSFLDGTSAGMHQCGWQNRRPPLRGPIFRALQFMGTALPDRMMIVPGEEREWV